MDIAKKILCLLVIFCILGPCLVAVSAEDTDGHYGDDFDGGYAGYQYDDFDGAMAAAENSTVDDGDEPAIPFIDPDYAHMEPGSNQTDNATNATPHVPAAGETVTSSTNNTVAAAHSTLPATGNPIIILLGVMAVLGGAGILRRKN